MRCTSGSAVWAAMCNALHGQEMRNAMMSKMSHDNHVRHCSFACDLQRVYERSREPFTQPAFPDLSQFPGDGFRCLAYDMHLASACPASCPRLCPPDLTRQERPYVISSSCCHYGMCVQAIHLFSLQPGEADSRLPVHGISTPDCSWLHHLEWLADGASIALGLWLSEIPFIANSYTHLQDPVQVQILSVRGQSLFVSPPSDQVKGIVICQGPFQPRPLHTQPLSSSSSDFDPAGGSFENRDTSGGLLCKASQSPSLAPQGLALALLFLGSGASHATHEDITSAHAADDARNNETSQRASQEGNMPDLDLQPFVGGSDRGVPTGEHCEGASGSYESTFWSLTSAIMLHPQDIVLQARAQPDMPVLRPDTSEIHLGISQLYSMQGWSDAWEPSINPNDPVYSSNRLLRSHCLQPQNVQSGDWQGKKKLWSSLNFRRCFSPSGGLLVSLARLRRQSNDFVERYKWTPFIPLDCVATLVHVTFGDQRISTPVTQLDAQASHRAFANAFCVAWVPHSRLPGLRPCMHSPAALPWSTWWTPFSTR